MITNQNANSVLDQAILDAKELLTSFASQDELLANFTTAFGDKYNRESMGRKSRSNKIQFMAQKAMTFFPGQIVTI